MLEKLFKKTDSSAILNEELSYQISHTRNEIEIANNNFNYADTSELIDLYTYKLKLLTSRYEYLLKKSRYPNEMKMSSKQTRVSHLTLTT